MWHKVAQSIGGMMRSSSALILFSLHALPAPCPLAQPLGLPAPPVCPSSMQSKGREGLMKGK